MGSIPIPDLIDNLRVWIYIKGTNILPVHFQADFDG